MPVGVDMKKILAASFGLLVLAISPGNTATIVGQFEGSVGFAPASFDPTIQSGDTLTGNYTFDSTAAALAGSNSTTSVFNALLGLNFTVGAYSASSAASQEIQVGNNEAFSDRYSIVSRASDGLTGPNIGVLALESFIIRLDDQTKTVFSDALILPTSLNLSSFDRAEFFLIFHNIDNPDSTFLISGRLTEFSVAETPIPAALPLFATGLGALGLLGWRRKKKAAALAT